MLLTCALVLTFATGALTPEKAAEIQRDQDKAMAKIDAKFGNKKPSELTPDEKREIVKARADAEKESLDKAGVSAKEWARYTGTMDRAETKEMKDAQKAIEKREEDLAAQKKAEGNGPQEIPIQRGFSDDDPVVMMEKEGAAPRVDGNIPLSEQDDAQQGSEAAEKETELTPAKGGKKKGGRRR